MKYDTVQEMIDDIDQELGNEYRLHKRRQIIKRIVDWLRYVLTGKIKRWGKS
jgi:hypothetical protein